MGLCRLFSCFKEPAVDHVTRDPLALKTPQHQASGNSSNSDKPASGQHCSEKASLQQQPQQLQQLHDGSCHAFKCNPFEQQQQQQQQQQQASVGMHESTTVPAHHEPEHPTQHTPGNALIQKQERTLRALLSRAKASFHTPKTRSRRLAHAEDPPVVLSDAILEHLSQQLLSSCMVQRPAPEDFANVQHSLSSILQWLNEAHLTANGSGNSSIGISTTIGTSSSNSVNPGATLLYIAGPALAHAEHFVRSAGQVQYWTPAAVGVLLLLLQLYNGLMEQAVGRTLCSTLLLLLLRPEFIDLLVDAVELVNFNPNYLANQPCHEAVAAAMQLWQFLRNLVMFAASTSAVVGAPKDLNLTLEKLGRLLAPMVGPVSRILEQPVLEKTLAIQLHVLWLLQTLFDMKDCRLLQQQAVADYYVGLHFRAVTQHYESAQGNVEAAAAELCRLHLKILRSMAKQPAPAVRERFAALHVVDFLLGEMALEADVLSMLPPTEPATEDAELAVPGSLVSSLDDNAAESPSTARAPVVPPPANHHSSSNDRHGCSNGAATHQTGSNAAAETAAGPRHGGEEASSKPQLPSTAASSSKFTFCYDLNEDLERLMALEDELGHPVELDGFEYDEAGLELLRREVAAPTGSPPLTPTTFQPPSIVIPNDDDDDDDDDADPNGNYIDSCPSSQRPTSRPDSTRPSGVPKLSLMSLHRGPPSSKSLSQLPMIHLHSQATSNGPSPSASSAQHPRWSRQHTSILGDGTDDGDDDDDEPISPYSGPCDVQPTAMAGVLEHSELHSSHSRPRVRLSHMHDSPLSDRGLPLLNLPSSRHGSFGAAASARASARITGASPLSRPSVRFAESTVDGLNLADTETSASTPQQQPQPSATDHSPAPPPPCANNDAAAAVFITAVRGGHIAGGGGGAAAAASSHAAGAGHGGGCTATPTCCPSTTHSTANNGTVDATCTGWPLTPLQPRNSNSNSNSLNSSSGPGPEAKPQIVPQLNLSRLSRSSASTDSYRPGTLSSKLSTAKTRNYVPDSAMDMKMPPPSQRFPLPLSTRTSGHKSTACEPVSLQLQATQHDPGAANGTSSAQPASATASLSTSTSATEEQPSYQDLANRKLMYSDKAVHLCATQIVLSLLLTPNGALDPVYFHQFPVDNGMPNVEHVLTWHLSSQAAADVVLELARPTLTSLLGAACSSQTAVAAAAAGAAVSAAGSSVQELQAAAPCSSQPSAADGSSAAAAAAAPAADAGAEGWGACHLSQQHKQQSKPGANRSAATARLLRLLSRGLFDDLKYTNLQFTARGMYGGVYRAKLQMHDGSTQQVMIKTIDLPASAYARCVLPDVFGEVSILEQYQGCEGICQLLDYGLAGDAYWLVMRRYRCSLSEWRQRQSAKPSEPRAAALYLATLIQVIDALMLLAADAVVHFDLKCANVLIDPLPGTKDGELWTPVGCLPPFRAVLADFGEARAYRSADEAYTSRNRGTEVYKSPEMLMMNVGQQGPAAAGQLQQTAAAVAAVAAADGSITETSDASDKAAHGTEIGSISIRGHGGRQQGAGLASDVWSLGCLAYEVLTGCVLFGGDYASVTHRVAFGEGDNLALTAQEREALGDVPSLINLIEWILTRDPCKRPSLHAIAEQVGNLISSLKVQAGDLPVN